MRGKRSKQYRKLMQQYGLTFGFREPYQILVDAQMLHDIVRFKMNFTEMLSKTLHGQIKPMITQCTIRQLYLLPQIDGPSPNTPLPPNFPLEPVPRADKDAILSLARLCERRKCNHTELEHPLDTFSCLTSVIDPKGSLSNKNRYVIAVQDEKLRAWARTVKGVPAIYVKKSVMVMEPMSEGSRGVKFEREKEKIRMGIVRGTGEVGKRKRDGDEDDDEVDGGEEEEKKKRKVKGPKGPNPLSVMKKKRKDPEADGVQVSAADEGAGEGQGNVLDGDGAVQKSRRRRKHKSSVVTTSADGGGDGAVNGLDSGVNEDIE